MPTLDAIKAKLPASLIEPDASLVDLVVARGRSVQHDGESYGPGTPLRFAKAEARHLIETGFAHEPGQIGILVAAPGVIPAQGVGPTINGDPGTVTRVR